VFPSHDFARPAFAIRELKEYQDWKFSSGMIMKIGQYQQVYRLLLYSYKNPFRVRRCSEGKGDGGNEEAIRKGPATLLPAVENSHGAV
jgi:hypothetical protein